MDRFIEITCLKDPLTGANEPGLDKVTEQNLQGLSVPLKHGKHEERQHDSDHDEGRQTGTDAILCQEKQRHAHKRAQTEADHLTLGQVEKEL